MWLSQDTLPTVSVHRDLNSTVCRQGAGDGKDGMNCEDFAKDNVDCDCLLTGRKGEKKLLQCFGSE